MGAIAHVYRGRPARAGRATVALWLTGTMPMPPCSHEHTVNQHATRYPCFRASNRMAPSMSLRGAQQACPRAGGGSNLNPEGGRLLRCARNDMTVLILLEALTVIRSQAKDPAGWQPQGRQALGMVGHRSCADSPSWVWPSPSPEDLRLPSDPVTPGLGL
jgi:hypothetical protein